MNLSCSIATIRNLELQTDPSITLLGSLPSKMVTDNEGSGFDFEEVA